MKIEVNVNKGKVVFDLSDNGVYVASGALCDMQIKKGALFTARLKNVKDGEQKIISSVSEWQTVAYNKDDNTFIFSKPSGVDGITVQFTFIKERDSIRWSGKVVNDNSEWSVMDIDYPTPVLGAPDFTIFIPHASGIAYKNAGKRGYSYDYVYPASRAVMQYFAQYSDNGGTYIGIEDGTGAIKRFVVNAKDDTATYKLTCYAPNASLGANSFELFGECRWQTFDGDWFDATMIYKKFVENNAKWLPELQENVRADLSNKFRDVAFWIADGMPNTEYQRENNPTSLCEGLGAYPPDYWKTAAIQLKKELGVPIAYHVYNWHEIPFNIEYPHFLPAKKEFIDGAKELQENGVYVVPYINAVSWETCDGLCGHKENFDTVGIDGAVITEKGEVFAIDYPQTTVGGNTARLAPICPSFERWTEIISELSDKMHKTLPIDGIYFDEIAAHQANLCYNKKHNHTLGGGTYWADGYNALMEQVKKTKPKDAYYFTECNAEPYMKGFDGFLSWYWMADEQVPAFSAVYGGYIQFVGRYMLGKKKPDYEFFKFNMAQSLLYGQQLGWYKADVVYNKKAMSFLKPLVKLRHKYNEFFASAKMLRPPVVDSDLEDKITTPALHYTEQVKMAQVSGALWQSRKDGKTVLFITNVSESVANAKVEFSLSGAKVLPPFEKTKDGNYSLQIKLEPYAILAWEFEKE